MFDADFEDVPLDFLDRYVILLNDVTILFDEDDGSLAINNAVDDSLSVNHK